MASINVSGSISNVPNGRYVVRVQLLDLDGHEIVHGDSGVTEVTTNPGPTVGAPTVTVAA